MSENQVAKKRGQKAVRTREAKRALLRSALEIVGESGFAGLTLAEVGVRAGYSRGLVQYHYGSKEALIGAMMNWAVRGGRHMLDTHAGKGLEAVLNGIAEYNRVRKEQPKVFRGYWALTAEMSYSQNPQFSEQIRIYQRNLRNTFADVFVAEGVSQQRADAIAMIALGGMRGLLQQWIAEDDHFDIDGGFETLILAITCLTEHGRRGNAAV